MNLKISSHFIRPALGSIFYIILLINSSDCFSQNELSKSIFFIEEDRWYHDYKFISEVLNLAREKNLKNVEFNIQKNDNYHVKALVQLISDTTINVIREDYRNSSCRLFYYKVGIIKGLFYLKEKRFIQKVDRSCVCNSENRDFFLFFNLSILPPDTTILEVFQYDTLGVMKGKFDKNFKVVKSPEKTSLEDYYFDDKNRLIKEVLYTKNNVFSTSYQYLPSDSLFICFNNQSRLGNYKYDIERKTSIDSISKKKSIKTIISKKVDGSGYENQEEYISSIKLEYLYKRSLPIQIKISELYEAEQKEELTIEIKYLKDNYPFEKYYKF